MADRMARMSRWQIWRQTLALAYRLEKIKAQMRRVGVCQ